MTTNHSASTHGIWQKDRADFSWSIRDKFGCFYRVTRVSRRGDLWAIAWSEEHGIRIGSHLYEGLEKAKEMVAGLMAIDDDAAGSAA